MFGASQTVITEPTSSMMVRSTVVGIAYSDSKEESVALLSINGTMLVCHVGQQLSDGQTVTEILSDRVLLSSPGGIVTAMLDIPEADTNQRMNFTKLATNAVPGDAPVSVGDETTAVPAAAPATLMPTRYLSRASLRGPDAAARFKELDKPAVFSARPRSHHP